VGEHDLRAILAAPVEDQVDHSPALSAGAQRNPFDDLGVLRPRLDWHRVAVERLGARPSSGGAKHSPPASGRRNRYRRLDSGSGLVAINSSMAVESSAARSGIGVQVGGLVQILGSGSEVVGPVSSGSSGPLGDGVDAQAKQVGGDGGGVVSGPRGAAGVACGFELDSVSIAFLTQGERGCRAAGEAPGEQQSCLWAEVVQGHAGVPDWRSSGEQDGQGGSSGTLPAAKRR